jgi:hypothetical protein
MKLHQLLDKYDELLENISTEISTIVTIDLTKENNQITFKLNDGLENVKGEVSNLPNSAGIYFFEVGLRDFYLKEMNFFEDWSVGQGETEFMVKRSHFFNALNELWEEREASYDETFPNIIRKRFFKYHYRKNPNRNSFETDEWIPFYLGVSKDIQKRVHEHVECDQPKYSSMKLSQFIGETEGESSIFCDFPIRVSYSEIPDLDKNNRYSLIEKVESKLRETFHPLVGKQ